MKLLSPATALAVLLAGPGGVAAADGPGAKIIGGALAPRDAYPWFARVADDNVTCGAFLISKQFVLSAAHCMYWRQSTVPFDNAANNSTVQIGAFAKPFGNGTDDPALNGGQWMESRRVVAQHKHPGWDFEEDNDYDFALLKLDAPAVTAPVPIDGHQGRDLVAGYAAGKGLVAIGHGLTSDRGSANESLSDVLKQADGDFLPQEPCNDLWNGYITGDWMMCTSPDPTQTACAGDSGGPLWDPDENVVVGLMSWGSSDGCLSEFPFVYARISSVIGWIQNTVCKGTDDPDADPFCDGYTLMPTPSPTVSVPPTLSVPPTPSPTPFTCDELIVGVHVTTDEYPDETSWVITDQDDEVLFSSAPYADAHTTHERSLCLPHAGYEAYKFTISDSWGDGMCCEVGNGSYKVWSDGKLDAEGGYLFREETTAFPSGKYRVCENHGDCVGIQWCKGRGKCKCKDKKCRKKRKDCLMRGDWIQFWGCDAGEECVSAVKPNGMTHKWGKCRIIQEPLGASQGGSEAKRVRPSFLSSKRNSGNRE